MVGTGLETSNPQLVGHHRTRPLPAASSFSVLCRDFNLEAQSVSALVCLSSRLAAVDVLVSCSRSAPPGNSIMCMVT
jgi:hypothetical protein